MGVIIKRDIAQGCKLGIWEIQESYGELLSNLNLDSEEIKRLESFKNEDRKLEWLSVRNLINEMTGTNSRIFYNEDRKPFLLDDSWQISISHSNKLTAILISRTRQVGIDLEFMSHKISGIEGRFIHDNEVITGDKPETRQYHLYIHWCAKEALFKLFDKQNINFRENLILDPFIPEDSGFITGTVDNVLGTESIRLEYFKTGDYIIVWSCK